MLKEQSKFYYPERSIRSASNSMKPIGKVIHYYGKVGVAIVRLEDELKLGDRVKFEKGEHAFEQEVGSMEKEYKPVEEAHAGDEVGMKVDEKAPKENNFFDAGGGDDLYKLLAERKKLARKLFRDKEPEK